MDTGASDFIDGKFELVPNIVISRKPTVGAIMWLEDKYDKPMDEINFASGRVKDVVNLLTALVLQSYPEMTEDDAVKAIKTVSEDSLRKATEHLRDAMVVDLKNSGRSVKPK